MLRRFGTSFEANLFLAFDYLLAANKNPHTYKYGFVPSDNVPDLLLQIFAV